VVPVACWAYDCPGMSDLVATFLSVEENMSGCLLPLTLHKKGSVRFGPHKNGPFQLVLPHHQGKTLGRYECDHLPTGLRILSPCRIRLGTLATKVNLEMPNSDKVILTTGHARNRVQQQLTASCATHINQMISPEAVPSNLVPSHATDTCTKGLQPKIKRVTHTHFIIVLTHSVQTHLL
jgi:hypothetical protein